LHFKDTMAMRRVALEDYAIGYSGMKNVMIATLM
jgi:hypothetical protein